MANVTPEPIAAYLAALRKDPHPHLAVIDREGRAEGLPLVYPETGALLHTLAIPRGQVLLAAGTAEPDATSFEVVAELGSETFGILSKNNEVTAIKSGGVSLYRVTLPIVAVAAVISVLAYFLLDFVLPYSNQRAVRLENLIKGKKTAVSLSTQQKLWFLGKGRYLINFLSYDRRAQELSQVQVFEFHPSEFRLTRRVYAQRARWDGVGWVFENGWMRSFPDNQSATYTPIVQPIRLYYAEKPEDFATEVKSPDQMTFAQLRRYIASIKSTKTPFSCPGTATNPQYQIRFSA